LTALSTALLMVGPSGIGSFHSPDWRVGGVAQLVEAGTNGPYWLYSDQDGDERTIHIDSLEPEIVSRSVLLLLGHLTNDPVARAWLRDTHNLFSDETGRLTVAPYWEIADEVAQAISAALAPHYRLGFVKLDDTTLVNEEVCAHLLALGFSVEGFISQGSMA
jgi:hypothetical protein